MSTAVYPATNPVLHLNLQRNHPVYQEAIDFIAREVREIVYGVIKVTNIAPGEIILYHREELTIGERMDELDQHLRATVDQIIGPDEIAIDQMEMAIVAVALDPYLITMLAMDTLPQSMCMCGSTWRMEEIGKIYRKVIKVTYYLELLSGAYYFGDDRLVEASFAYAIPFAHNTMCMLRKLLRDRQADDQISLIYAIETLLDLHKFDSAGQFSISDPDLRIMKDLPESDLGNLGNGPIPANW
jgi:hypothetical protein